MPPGYPLPDLPPVPPVYWRRKEPIGAIILIALGVLFLLGHFDWFSGRVLEFTWPILLIGLGVWLIVRRLSETKAISQGNSDTGSQGGNNESLHHDSPIAWAGSFAADRRDGAACRRHTFLAGARAGR